jgi:hypothetical protein
MFSQADFQGDSLHRLCVITMNSLGKDPMTQFHTLSYASQKEFDNKMNEYIRNLPAEGWEQVILDNFHTIFHTKIMDDGADITKFRCDEIVSDVQHIAKDAETPENIMFAENIDEPKLCEDI